MKTRSLIALLFICLFRITASAQNQAVIEFENKQYDFGTILEGSPVSHEFVFTNTGTIPLVLSNVQPSCGCTTPEWPREPIMPGKKGKIKAIYNPGAYKGAFTKGISVLSNATENNVQLIFKGTVEAKPAIPQSPVKLQQNEGGF